MKNASTGLAFFVELTGLAEQGGPALDGLGAPLGFPLFQSLVVAALGLDDFAGVRVLLPILASGSSREITSRRDFW